MAKRKTSKKELGDFMDKTADILFAAELAEKALERNVKRNKARKKSLGNSDSEKNEEEEPTMNLALSRVNQLAADKHISDEEHASLLEELAADKHISKDEYAEEMRKVNKRKKENSVFNTGKNALKNAGGKALNVGGKVIRGAANAGSAAINLATSTVRSIMSEETSKPKKYILIGVSVLVLGGVGYGIYKLSNYQSGKRKKTTPLLGLPSLGLN